MLATTQVGWGGGERFLVDLGEELQRRGLHVQLLAPFESAIGRMWRGELLDGRPKSRVELALFNDFRSLRRWGMWSPQRIFLVHGWWQASRARALAAAILRATAFPVSSAVGTALERVSRGIPLRIREPLPIGAGATYRPPDRSERAAAREALGFGAQDRVAIFVGRYQGVKRPELFIDAVAAAGWKGVMFCSASFGGAEEMHLRAAVRNRIEAGDTHIRLIENSDPLVGVHAADCLLSTSEFESLGIAMLESLAAGVPVISTASGGPRDFIDSGKNGWLVPTNTCAQGLGQLLEQIADAPMAQSDCINSVANRGPVPTADALLRA